MIPCSLSITNFLARPATRRWRAHHDDLKRPIELLLALVGLAISAPVLVVLGALVKLTSRGPAIYSQIRLGKGGRPFRILKLRTMVVAAEHGGPCWSAVGDPRVTALGRFLRKTHLDELPQLWNVVRGEMSLVGPRPERPHFVAELRRQIPLYVRRLAVRPGLTGLAQVRHGYDQTIEDVQAKLAYDLEYIRDAGLGLDTRVLALTAVKIVTGRGGS
jgi:lipopolysaccharide/colanic/teichoic acid biosynthesis glycosyltransferase